MGNWKIINKLSGNVIHEENGDTTFSYAFDENYGTGSRNYEIVFTDDYGRSGKTDITQNYCECVSEYVTAGEQTSGNCFCEGIGYKVWIYDKCDPFERKLKTETGSFVFDSTYTGETGNSLTYEVPILYSGRIYDANVQLESTSCSIVPVKVVLYGEHLTSNPLTFISGFNTISATIGDYYYANIGNTQNISLVSNAEFIYSDKVRYCNASSTFTRVPTVQITFPTTFQARVSDYTQGESSIRTFTYNSSGDYWIGPPNPGEASIIDAHIRFQTSASISDGTLVIKVNVTEESA